MAAAAIVKNLKKTYLGRVRPILTKFGTLVQFDSLDRSGC